MFQYLTVLLPECTVCVPKFVCLGADRKKAECYLGYREGDRNIQILGALDCDPRAFSVVTTFNGMKILLCYI